MEKIRVTYNISKKVLDKFNEITKKMSFKKSGIVESLILKWTKQQNLKKTFNDRI